MISSFLSNAQKFKYLESFDGQKIAYEDTGRGKPILLLHGFINTGANWRKTELYKNLIAKGFRVIVPDLRGNGASDKPHEDKYYQNDAEVRDLMGIISALEIKDYTLVGYSRGAIVAAKLLTKDKRVTKAILGGIGQYFTNPDWDRRKMFADAFSGKAHLHPETAGAVNYAKSIGVDTIALGFLQKYQPVTLPSDLMKYKKSVLIICGDEDLDNGDPKILQTYFRKATLKTVKGNHNGTYRTQAFSDEIIDFIEK
jgi:pimeloyl-ACP methyl ester carboxylesterase